MGCIPTGSSVYGISHPRILEWVAISSSRNVLNITKQLTSSLRWMSAWGLLILGKVNQTFQKLYSLLTGVPRDFQGRHTASYTRDTAQPTGPTYAAGITSCCASQKLSPGKPPPHLLVSHYPEPTSEFPAPRAAPAMPFSGYHHYKWRRKDNFKVKMSKRQSWNKGESSQI